jgi:hypothetical protein
MKSSPLYPSVFVSNFLARYNIRTCNWYWSTNTCIIWYSEYQYHPGSAQPVVQRFTTGSSRVQCVHPQQSIVLGVLRIIATMLYQGIVPGTVP